MRDEGHERAISAAFDGQAALFERAPVQSDPSALARLVAFARLTPESEILDVGCGPGLVAEAFLAAGHRVTGIDLSIEMVERARRRCARFGERAVFRCGSFFTPDDRPATAFDAVVSRFVLHHMVDPAAFFRGKAAVVKPGGIVLLVDHTTERDINRRSWHQDQEKLRDVTHMSNLTMGEIVDGFADAGLGSIEATEESFDLDFDEWFDRGTPIIEKSEARKRLLAGPGARGFDPESLKSGAVRIGCWRAMVRGVRPLH
jgi:SAM-dependent methyltransferase